jgi:hypothetical protein
LVVNTLANLAVGIGPETLVYNHMDQLRDLLKAKPVTKPLAKPT